MQGMSEELVLKLMPLHPNFVAAAREHGVRSDAAAFMGDEQNAGRFLWLI